MTEIDKSIGMWLRAIRIQAGLSQEQLAKRTGIGNGSQSAVWAIETGAQRMRLSEALVVAKLLDEPLPQLEVSVPDVCDTCGNRPPVGFTCNVCGLGGAS